MGGFLPAAFVADGVEGSGGWVAVGGVVVVVVVSYDRR